jgi:prepilin-type N-terminal cleavage/methylation domain-containing protein
MKQRQYRESSGFTLLEIMFAVLIMAVLSGIVLTAFTCFHRATAEWTTYATTHAEARRALTLLSADVHEARTIAVSTNGGAILSLHGGGSLTISYALNGGILRRTYGNQDRVLCNGLHDMQAELMTHDGKPASETDDVGMVRATLTFVTTGKKVAATNTFSVVAATRNASSR